MKLSPETLIEIMSIIQNALLNQTDASQSLRDMELNVEGELIVVKKEK